jgi:pyruvate dehydrogenase E1 component alpha subunit
MELLMKMPDLATTDSDIKLVRWLVQPGQSIQRGQPLFEVETDKAISQVEAIATGVLKLARALPGSSVAVGQIIAVLEVPLAADSSLAKHMTPQVPPSHRVGLTSASGVSSERERVSDGARTVTALPPANPSPPYAQSAGKAVEPSGVSERAYDRAFLLSLYERMVLIREFEERVKFLFLEGSMPGTIHQCQGQEATAVGVCAALRSEDWITSTFRGHGHALAKGLTVQELLDELFGARTGCCKGKGGSMHVGNLDRGMLPGIAIVAGGIPLAVGMALAFKMQKSSQVVACFFGDGAIAEGAFHEASNMAALWALPIILVCENNMYGASTHISKVMKNPRVSDRAMAYGFRGETVDGNDVLAVYAATLQAASECREGKGPVLLELLTYRRTGHSRRDPCHYQAKDEQEVWFNRDPLEHYAAQLLQANQAAGIDLEQIRARVEALLTEAVQKAKSAPLPTVDELHSDVFANPPGANSL